MELPSHFQIKDEITFIPMFRHQHEMGISDDQIDGVIVAIKFTESKVWYDIYNNYWNKIFDGIDSVKVYREPAVELTPEPSNVN